jgi:hypothetical protein
MILPTKHIRIENSLLGVSSQILMRINNGQTVSSLWNEAKTMRGVRTFERFTLALDFLYAIGALDLQEGLLRRTPR